MQYIVVVKGSGPAVACFGRSEGKAFLSEGTALREARKYEKRHPTHSTVVLAIEGPEKDN